MSNDPAEPRSRRALLAAAAGGAAALAASAALPLTTLAADGGPVLLGTANDATLQTTVTQATNAIVAFKAKNVTTGAAALVGSSGDEPPVPPDTSFTGVYGWSPTANSDILTAAGVWGDSDDYGVVGTGAFGGVAGFGGAGVVGIGSVDGVVGVGGATGAGVLAFGGTPTDVALDVQGKVKFSRSGRSTIGARKASIRVNLAGVSSGSRVFAVLHSSRPGRYVRAVVPTTGYFTIYLNTTVRSRTHVAWFVIN